MITRDFQFIVSHSRSLHLLDTSSSEGIILVIISLSRAYIK